MKFRLFVIISALLPFLIQCNATKKVYSGEEYKGDIDTSYTENYDNSEDSAYDTYDDSTYDNGDYGYDDYDDYDSDYSWEQPDTVYSPWSTKLYRASATKVNDLVHTKLEVRFDWAKAWMYGKATITLKPHFYPTSQLVLDARGFDIREVSMVGPSGKTPLHFIYNTDSVPDTTQITIDLGRSYARDENYTIYIDYIAKPNTLPQGGSNAITDDKGLYFINNDGADKNKPMQIWTQGETESNSAWFPTIDKPDQKCTDEIYITVNDKYQTLSNGVLASSKENGDGTRTDYWKMDLPQAPYLFMMAIGEFSIVKDSWKGMPVNYYVEKEYAPYAKDIFGNTPEMIDFFSTVLHYKYPWPKYSQVVVRDYVSGAMENTTATLHGDFLQQTPREMLDDNYEDVISHELFHQWFGDLVTCESWSNIPLNESFATYGEYLWREHKYGKEDADYLGYTDLQTYLNEASYKWEDLIRFHYENNEDVFDSHSYAKGGRVLHMLREYLGDDAFFAGLNKYLTDNKFSNVEIENLRLAMEAVSGQDLHWFFDEWFLGEGHPDLDISYDYDADLGMETITMEQDQDTTRAPVYVLPMDVDIYANGTVERHRIVFDRNIQQFSFPVSVKPDLVNVDAQKMLLCTKSDNKDLDAWVFQYRHAPLLMDRLESVQWLASEQSYEPEARAVIESAIQDPYWAIRQFALDTLLIDDQTSTAVKNAIAGLVLHDPKSAVRASALNRLAALGLPDMMQTLNQAVNDSSYLVEAAALNAIYAHDPDAGYALAGKFTATDNYHLNSTVSKIIGEQGDAKDNAYFVTRLANSEGYKGYYIMLNYEPFLKRMHDFTVIQQGVDALEKIAANKDNFWMSLSANGILGDLQYTYQQNVLNADANDKQQYQMALDYVSKVLDALNAKD